MPSAQDKASHAAALIADHLDRILAAGEDLVKLRYQVNAPDDVPGRLSLNGFVQRCRSHELGAVAALLRAREHAETLATTRTAFAPMARLFVASTTAILDTIDNLVDRDGNSFDGHDPLAFLRSRGVVDGEVGCLKTHEEIAVTEDFLISGAIHLGSLMDLAATLLDALDNTYGLFPAPAGGPDDTQDAGAKAAPGPTLTLTP